VKTRIIIGFLVGVALAVALFRAFGTNSIGHAFGALGWAGFALIVAFQLGLIVFSGIAWWLLVRGRSDAPPWQFVWGRLIRDAASQALPLSQLGGMVLGARALAIAGVSPALATASLIVDIGIELAGLIFYSLIGLALLCYLQPASGLIVPIAAVLAVLAAMAGAFVVVQVRGSNLVGGWLARLTTKWTGARTQHAFGLPQAIRQIHARLSNLALAWVVHLVCWVLTAVQMWLTLRLMDVPVGFGKVVVIDSLTFGIRTIAFMVPGGIGVQEGAFILLGGLFGVGAQTALALSLIRRGRDLVIAIPTLIGWQLQENGVFGRRRSAVPDAEPAREIGRDAA
jgi:putative membrane protein